jgi:tRNA threonylcarbamoyladenosine biosynthesis protein TsaB
VNALALDTATEVLSLSAQSGDAWASLSVRRGLQHSPSLLPLAERLLSELGMTAADLQLVVCSLGPGSFTGIRIGLATAMGIGQGRHIPVVGVSTLDAGARAWRAYPGDLFPVIDARKGRIYTARYRDGERQGDYLDVHPADFSRILEDSSSPMLAGAEAPRIRDLLGEAWRGLPVVDAVDPRCLLQVGLETNARKGEDGAPLLPLYLRKSEAELMRGRR